MADFGMTWRGPEVSARVTGAKRTALGKGAALLLARTIPDVPLQDGPLSDSGAIDVDDEAASVYFDTPYAVRQHEDMTLHHHDGRIRRFGAYMGGDGPNGNTAGADEHQRVITDKVLRSPGEQAVWLATLRLD